MLLSCTASDGCPVHCKRPRIRWSFVDTLETLESVTKDILYLLYNVLTTDTIVLIFVFEAN